MKYFIIIDEQADFNTGALANEDNQKIVSAIVAKAKEAKENGYRVIATRDTHGSNYMDTQEGKNLPVPHCIKGTPGWEVIDEIKPYVDDFIEYASQHKEYTFLVTRIGCGIAGFKANEIAPLFAKAINLENVLLPKDFVAVIEQH